MSDSLSSVDRAEILRRAYVEMKKLRARVDELEQSRSEPIAIIGMACRFPGGASNPQRFWELLRDGRDAIAEVPAERWRAAEYYDPDPAAPRKMCTRYGGFLDSVDRFDPQFFGITPREAVWMDPQQRLLLEIAWESLEDAGLAPQKWNGSRTGVFVGMCTSDYSHLMLSREPDISAYMGSGSSHSVGSGRLSYVLGLQGPSLTVDTACSSSLVCAHLACQSLRNEECTLALAGGVNMILTPESNIMFSKAHMLAPDGRCKTFDAAADGYVRSEGCGMVVLKRYRDALRDGDRVLALIRGSALNQDGHSSGLTVPNGPAQEDVIREALRDAGVDPAQIAYVEAHGTGTSLGDPIELQALGRALCAGRDAAHRLIVGSVKTNLGHLEAAAGMAALIKTVLALRHEEIPPHLHFNNPNPRIPWADLPVTVPVQRIPWPSGNGRRLAGVSSFGFSGTNAHVVMEEAPAVTAVQEEVKRPMHILRLSAKSAGALAELTSNFENSLAANPDEPFEHICFTANTGRSHFASRLTVCAETSQQALDRLLAFAAGRGQTGIVKGEVETGKRGEVVFLFTGQGSQYAGMGRRLYETQPTFRKALARCDEFLRPFLARPLLDILYPNSAADAALDQTAFAQPALFALEYALIELWRSWGVRPDAVLGHSAGEYAAAYAAGVFSLEDALTLVAHRSRLMQSLPERGEMAAVFASEERVSAAIAPYGNQVALAALNGPESTVISGTAECVRKVLKDLERENVHAQTLSVSHAFHSLLMDPMLEEFGSIARKIRYAPPNIQLVSNLTGRLAGAGEISCADYWPRHVRHGVRFSAGMQTLRDLGHKLFLEIGPSPTLIGLGRRCFADGDAVWLTSLRKMRDEWEQMLESLASLYVHGVEIDWSGFDRDYSRRKVSLPTYPFERQRYWVDGAAPHTLAAFGDAEESAQHPLLGRRVRSPAIQATIFERRLQTNAPAFLEDHRVYGAVVVPGAGYVSMLLSALKESPLMGRRCLEDVSFPAALVLEESLVRRLQIILQTEANAAPGFQIFSGAEPGSDNTAWVLHATGKFGKPEAEPINGREKLAITEIQQRCVEEFTAAEFYQKVKEAELQLGQRFRWIEHVWRRDGEALCRMRMPEPGDEIASYELPPGLVDSCFQLMGATVQAQEGAPTAYAAIGVDKFHFYQRPGASPMWCHVVLRPGEERRTESFASDIRLVDETGAVLAVAEGMRIKRAPREALLHGTAARVEDWLYEIAWEPSVRLRRGLAPEYLTSPAGLARDLKPRVANANAEYGLEVYDRLAPELERLSAAYAWQAAVKLFGELQPGGRLDVALWESRLPVDGPRRRMFDVLIEILDQEKVLARDAQGWAVQRTMEGRGAPERHAALLEAYPQCAAELNIVATCGERLAEVVQGEIDPLQVLFPGGSLAAVEKLYQDSLFARALNGLVREAVGKAIERLPEDRLLRVLEIGAGTGGTTAYVLPRLPAGRTEYVFTDVSAVFLPKAQEKFREFPFVRYQVLDIEQDPAGQGIDAHGYDLVLASNVLHATGNLRETLKNARRLLAPQGLLVVVEGTERQRWVDLVFGLTDGWWRFTDRELRPRHALLGQSRWVTLIEEAGFTGAVGVPEEVDGRGARQSILLAQAPAVSESPKEGGGSWLIFADDAGIGGTLARKLEARGEPCITVVAGSGYERRELGAFNIDPSSPAHFDRLWQEAIAAPSVRCRGVVHCWSVDAVGMESMTPESLDAGQALGSASALHLVQTLCRNGGSRPPRLWVVTKGAQAVGHTASPLAVGQAGLWGLGKVVAIEHPELRCVRVDLDPMGQTEALAAELSDEIAFGDKEDQVAIREGVRYAARLTRSGRADGSEIRLTPPPGESYRLEIAQRGVLDNLELRASPRRPPGRGEVEIKVAATGLNFRDVLNAMGMYPGEVGPLGLECSGKIVAVGEGVEGLRVGDEVLAMARESFSPYVTTYWRFAARKPERMSWEEAATIPIAFLTAYYSLKHLAGLTAGERVLIHAAAGGVGLAAVQLAQLWGAEIWATAGSAEKQEFLWSLGIEQVMSSRTLDFAGEVMRRTAGEGVDVVLNSLAGEFIPRSLSAVAKNGRFVEIGMTGVWSASQVSEARSDVGYFAYDLSRQCREDPDFVGSMLSELMMLFAEGKLRPLPRRVFGTESIVGAFRYMQQAKHIGKIVVSRVGAREGAQAGPVAFGSAATYLITGGLRGLGLLVAEWMVEHGARNLVLAGRSEPGADAAEALERLRARTEKLLIVRADVSREEQVAGVLAEIAATMPPLRGVVHSAGMLDDGVLLDQNWQRFTKVMGPKVQGSWHLHAMTAGMPLDFFVLFSSVVSLLGSPGQGNHAVANSFMDALAHYRRECGLPGLSINWGAWSEVGAAARRNVGGRAKLQGIAEIGPLDGLRVLERIWSVSPAQVGVLPVDWKDFFKRNPAAAESAFLSHFVREARASVEASGLSAARADLLRRLHEARPAKRHSLLLTYVVAEASKVLGLDPARPLDPRRPLNELGLDSLMAVELRNALGHAAGRTLPVTLLFDYPTVEALTAHLAKEVFSLETAAKPAAEPARVPEGAAPSMTNGSPLSRDELLASLDEELAILDHWTERK